MDEEHPEIQWLAHYRDGDTEALGKMVEHFRRPLFAFILRMTEGHGDADEVFQEVWMRVIKNQHRYKEKSFKSWLFRIAHNLVIDRARKRKPQVDIQRAGVDAEDFFETRLETTELNAPAVLEGREIGLRIGAAVEGLPEDQREVFLMRTEADLPFKEIARIQGTSINTALARMSYALNKLRDSLKTEYEELQKA